MSEQSAAAVPEMTGDVDIHDQAFALDPFPTYDRLMSVTATMARAPAGSSGTTSTR